MSDSTAATTGDVGSGASSPAPAPAADSEAPATAAPGEAPDAGRRRFFRAFAGELFQTAATVVGAASVLQRSSAEAAGAIFDPERGAMSLAAAVDAPGTLRTGAPAGFRTAYRLTDDDRVLLVVDQRRLPHELVEHPVRNGAEAAWTIRRSIVRGGPAVAQVAALGLALTASLARASRPYARRSAIRGAARTLADARPASAHLRLAVARMLATLDAVGDLGDGDEIARALRAEADAIVLDAMVDHGRLADAGVGALPAPVADDRPLRLLTHGSSGPLASGQFGTALGVVQAAHHAGRAMHVWVGETRPGLDGARVTAWELRGAGVPHTVVPDVAAATLLARGEVDAVLVTAELVAGNGDTLNEPGTYPLAVLARRHAVPFLVCAPVAAVDLATPDGDSVPREDRTGEEHLRVDERAIAPDGTAAFVPAFDVTPAELVTAFVTDEGILEPPFGPALAAATERRRGRAADQPALAGHGAG